MHEMEGPRPASQVRPTVARRRFPTSLSPGPMTRLKARSPAPSCVPWVAPGWSPFPVVSAFVLLAATRAQGFSGSILMIFLLSTLRPQGGTGYPPERAFLHRYIHRMIHSLD
jgi:hypothetical protein